MAKGPKKPRNAPKTLRHAKPVGDDDMDDEIDAFHKQRDVVPLDVDDDAVDSDDEEFPVLGIEDSSDSSDDDSDEGKSDDAGDDDDDICDDKEIAKMKRQAKYMEQIVGGNEEISDDAEPEKESRAPWGRRKSTYYTTDGRDNESSDEEKSKAEEAEAVRMQKERLNFLRMEDLDLPSDSDLDPDENDSGQEKIFKGISGGMETMAKSKDDNILGGTPSESFEERKSQKDINTLSKEEQMNLVYRYAPEMVPWLSELKDAHAQLEKVKPFLSKVGEKKDTTKGRMHYMEVKNILLLAYIQAISCYLLLKLEGHSVRDHPVKARISEIQNLSKQMNQIEMNLPSELEQLINVSPVNDLQDKLVRESVSSERKPEMPKITVELHEAPSLNKATKLTDDHSKAASQKHQDVLMSLQSKEMLKVRANLEAKLKQKGIYNLANAKPERHRNHALTPVNQRLETLEDFDDEVQHVSRGRNNVRTNVSNPLKISQMVVATKAKKAKFVSGDDDLPKRDDIGERRRKHELRVLAGAAAESMDINAQEDGEAQDSENELYKEAKKHRRVTAEDDDDHNETEDAENEFYKQVKKQRTEKLQAKEEIYSRVSVFPPPLEAEADNGKRHITRQIEKNRGLTRHRKKETKTPRKNNRVKFEKAQKRRKGQVRDIKKPSGPYGGEQTGINTNVSHSVRFRN